MYGRTMVLAAACALIAACGTGGTSAAPATTAATTPTTVIATATMSGNPPATGATTACATASLRVTLGQGEGAAGHYYVPIVFTNTGRACTITGYPGVSYYAGADQHQVGDPAAREPDTVRTLVLGTGESAYAALNQVNVDNFDPAVCQPVAATGLRVYPPNNTGSVLLPEPNARGCARSMVGQQQLTVRAVAEGSGPN
ncbi:DUF4232 domain-containing protein [Kutzneria sp. CA-103260]|uniref:DUF4232 domain-containing protein n=1 Tax=Kutzneria sp. CA-103260 TaxID=2802641 RepID=UPI001BA5694A|nr:DUF4232 domain-containing protein [Kutzneria sp. CA-103260]QUQ64095.1 hypothetical protein JJ691_18150 [Kutzneria sp. CA-103260]